MTTQPRRVAHDPAAPQHQRHHRTVHSADPARDLDAEPNPPTRARRRIERSR